MAEDCFELGEVTTYPLAERKNKVSVDDFVSLAEQFSLQGFLDSLPNQFAGKTFRNFLKNWTCAVNNQKMVVLMMGAHVIKCGLSPMVIDLIRRKYITAVAFNGAGAVHDFEIAYQGATSEEVSDGLKTGSFGMAEETGRIINQCWREYGELGAGYALGKHIAKSDYPHKDKSILAAAFDAGVPLTVHVALGTDIVHQHPTADGSAIGQASFQDFKRFISVISKLSKGVIINFGSAVILPEVFLKALTTARNCGHVVQDFTAANFDMIYHYRPRVNVVCRPTESDGQGFNFIGQHELMFPLLYYGILSEKRTVKNE